MAHPAEDLIQLSALIDGELSGAEAGRTRKRLTESALLRDEFRRIKSLCAMLERWDHIDSRHVVASPTYQATLLERLRRLRASERKPTSLLIPISDASRN